MSIPETLQKIKSQTARTGQGILMVMIAILGLGSAFVLGRISVLAPNPRTVEPIQIIYPPLVATNVPTYKAPNAPTEPATWAFAASQTGKTYYPRGCTGLNRIKPENRIYFTTEDQALQSGLTRSKTC